MTPWQGKWFQRCRPLVIRIHLWPVDSSLTGLAWSLRKLLTKQSPVIWDAMALMWRHHNALFAFCSAYFLQVILPHDGVMIWKYYSALLALCEGNHRSPVDFLRKGLVTRNLMFLWCTTQKTFEQTVEWLVIWDAMTPTWFLRNDIFRCFFTDTSAIVRWRMNMDKLNNEDINATISTPRAQTSAMPSLKSVKQSTQAWNM